MIRQWWRTMTGQDLREKLRVAEEMHKTGVTRLRTATDGILERTKLQRADTLMDQFAKQEKKAMNHD